MIHPEPHPLTGLTVQLNETATDPIRNAVTAGAYYRVEDWWDRVAGGSWTDTATTSPAAKHYAARRILADLPADNLVVYGKVDGLGHLVHASELPAVAG